MANYTRLFITAFLILRDVQRLVAVDRTQIKEQKIPHIITTSHFFSLNKKVNFYLYCTQP